MDPSVVYAGVKKRFLAVIIDYLILFPLFFLQKWLYTKGKSGIYTALVTIGPLMSFYFVYCHAKYGKTIGKRITNIKVVSLDFIPINWQQSIQRSSFDLVISSFNIVSFFIALEFISDAEIIGLKSNEISKLIFENRPAFANQIASFTNLWFICSAFFVMINSKKRALHDLLGNTVVLDEGHKKTKHIKLKDLY